MNALTRVAVGEPHAADYVELAHGVAERVFSSSSELDQDGAFPADGVRMLSDAGLLTATLPRQFAGGALANKGLFQLLRAVGYGSLPLGRLYEGHVNALLLVITYGDAAQKCAMSQEAGEGALFAVWNTDPADALHLVQGSAGYELRGRKILASGAGFVRRPLVTAKDERGRKLMVLPLLDLPGSADLSSWRAHGMRASATGAVDFTGVRVGEHEILGGDGDYERQPAFSSGAWRFLAVQLGGAERVFDLLREHLRKTGRGADPHQAARLGQAAIAIETAGLWTLRAAEMAEAAVAEVAPAYVNLARLAVERAALDVIEIAQRSVGLQAFMRPSPLERVCRDLSTYLRQPAPDRALVSAAAFINDREAIAARL